MSRDRYSGPVSRLNVETLEDRTVLSSFGATRGMSIAYGNAIPNFGTNEFVTGTGPGVRALVRIWSPDGTLLTSFNPFGNFKGGVFVALGNLDGSTTDPDNELELIVSTGPGTTGRVKVYDFSLGFQVAAAFVPFGPNYSGGVEITAGNVTGDRPQEIIVGQQSQGSLVRVFSDINLADNSLQFAAIRSFSPFGTGFFGGVSLASANVDFTQNTATDPYDYDYAEVIVGKASQEPRVKIFDVQTPTVTQRGSFVAFEQQFAANRNGVNLVAGSTDARRGAEIYVAIKGSSRIRIFDGQTLIQRGEVFPFLASGSRMTNMAINQSDDDFFDIYSTADLIAVRADGPREQVPLIYPGRTNSPAGLNGSRFAP